MTHQNSYLSIFFYNLTIYYDLHILRYTHKNHAV